MKNNKGLSYVELLVAISILTIATALAAISMSVVSGTNVNSGVEKLRSAYNNARMTSLAKGASNGSLYLRFESDKLYCFVGSQSDPLFSQTKSWELISKKPVKVTLIQEDGTRVAAAGTLCYSFKQDSGTLKNCPFTEIELATDKRKSTLKIYKYTGKCEIK